MMETADGTGGGTGGEVYHVRVLDTIADVPADTWNGLADVSSAGSDAAFGVRGNPFVQHAFLSALEDSKSVGGRSGWIARHLVLETAGGGVLGAVPCYLKGNSQGEYVFDHGWADAFQRAGGRYYPKLQIAVPFTPANGPRLLVGPSEGADARRAALCSGIEAFVAESGVSSAHATFLQPDDLSAMAAAGFLHRTDQQFHFRNRGYATYDDFLATLASRKRKALKRERREALANDITIEWLTGSDLTEGVWDAFFAFYTDTGSRKWGRPYLTRRFFSLVGARMGERILLVMARRAGRYIAGALNFLGDDTIYGRHWGAIEEHPFLHFEVCYHQAIDYAIAHRLAVVEAGAQGEHKLARGYEPTTTHSAHFIRHPGLRQAIEDHLEHERRQVERMQDLLQEHTPFRHEPD